jgi:hypothetical protein
MKCILQEKKRNAMSSLLSPNKSQEWFSRVQKQIESGLSVNRWCKEHSISPNTFRYWRAKFFPKLNLKRSSFAEIVEESNQESSGGIVIEYNNALIHIEQHFCPLVLKQIFNVLKEIKC